MDKLIPDTPSAIIRRALTGDEILPTAQLSDAAKQCVQALKEGKLALFGGEDTPALLPLDGPVMDGRPTATLAAAERLAAMHPAFADFLRACRQAAAAHNADETRLGFYFSQLSPDGAFRWQPNWIKNSIPAYRDLYIELSFLFLSPNPDYSVAFGSYCNHGCSSPLGMKGPYFMEQSWVDLSALAPLWADGTAAADCQKRAARAFAGKLPFPCPFCGYRFVKGGLLGRKCPGCKKILPKF